MVDGAAEASAENRMKNWKSCCARVAGEGVGDRRVRTEVAPPAGQLLLVLVEQEILSAGGKMTKDAIAQHRNKLHTAPHDSTSREGEGEKLWKLIG